MKKAEREHCAVMLKEEEYPVWKKYLWSSLQTFLATFLSTLATMLASLDSLALVESLSWSFIAGILVTCLRAAIKAMFEQWITPVK